MNGVLVQNKMVKWPLKFYKDIVSKGDLRIIPCSALKAYQVDIYARGWTELDRDYEEGKKLLFIKLKP